MFLRLSGYPGDFKTSRSGQSLLGELFHSHGGREKPQPGRVQAPGIGLRIMVGESGTGLGKAGGKRDRYDIDKMGSFGLWFGDATNSAGRSWWNGFSRLESR